MKLRNNTYDQGCPFWFILIVCSSFFVVQFFVEDEGETSDLKWQTKVQKGDLNFLIWIFCVFHLKEGDMSEYLSVLHSTLRKTFEIVATWSKFKQLD